MSIQISNGTLIQMPGGEWHIKNDGLQLSGEQHAVIRGGLPDDMVALMIWADAVHRDKGTPRLFIPYLPGARQDRRQPGEALSCKVYADIINSCNLAEVICVDPHSDVMPALINNCRIIPIEEVFKLFSISVGMYVGVIAPDAGANKRAASIANALKVPLYQALKKRDSATGKLSGFNCEKLPDNGKLLVVDDICDGGGTFKGLVSATNLTPERVDLFVTHGVFSKGSEDLYRYFGRIYTTDSHPHISVEYEVKFMKILRQETLPAKYYLRGSK